MRAFPDTTALRDPRALDDLLLYCLWRAMRAGSGMATRIAEGGFGITHREWEIIGMLAQVGEIGPSALAVQLQLDGARTSRGLRSLFEKRLIERRQDSEDRREVHVQLSETGLRLFEDMFPRISALNTDLLEGLDAEHQGIFLQCLRDLELHSIVLNARFAVSEKSDRRAAGARHHWSRQSR